MLRSWVCRGIVDGLGFLPHHGGKHVPKVIVLFNLRDGVTAEAYESWAQSVDVPTVAGLESVDGFTIHRIGGLLGTDAPAPYEYVELIEVNDLETLGRDVSTATMASVAQQFQEFADAPIFMVADRFAGT
jgi:hypothetical protein